MGLRNIFRGARALGDTSALNTPASAAGRAGRRALGRGVSRPMVGMDVGNILFWAASLDWIRVAVRRAAAKDVWIVNQMKYSKGYNQGFVDPEQVAKGLTTTGYKFWERGIQTAFRNLAAGDRRTFYGRGSNVRSGLYSGGRFIADMKAITNGSLGARMVRRTAGRSASRFFWGTISNPQYNYMEKIAEECVKEIRYNIRQVPLWDTGALTMATQWGNSLQEAKNKSRQAARLRIGRSPTGPFTESITNRIERAIN